MLHEIATTTRPRGDLSRLWRSAGLTILFALAGVTQLVAMSADPPDPLREVYNEGPMGFGRRPTAACVCGLPPDSGPCDAAIPRWYRPLYGDRCRQFVWGGCFGNANNFESEEACEQACLETCILPPHPSDCCAAVPMWFYSPDTGRCEEFLSGGCVGYPLNAFSTRVECDTVCLPPD